MQLLESGEMYLETILILSQQKKQAAAGKQQYKDETNSATQQKFQAEPETATQQPQRFTDECEPAGHKTMVRAVDISEYMGFSKPSVSRGLGILKSGGYITVEADGCIKLLPEGRAIAEKIYERHRVLTEFLTKLGVPEPQASDDACKMEHDISDESFDAIVSHMKNM